MSLLSHFKKGKAIKRQHDDGLDGGDVAGVRLQRKGALVTVDLDRFSPDSQADLIAEVARRSGHALFEDRIRHGYSKVFAGQTDTCPRCNSTTRQYTANFIYATDTACRVMLAPAGYFCKACPTVIVDEQMIAVGMKAGYRFRRVVGVDYFGKQDSAYFGTWNGEKTTYILDENEQIMDMVVDSEMRAPSYVAQPQCRGAAKKAKAKRKQVEKSRRRNRKKR